MHKNNVICSDLLRRLSRRGIILAALCALFACSGQLPTRSSVAPGFVDVTRVVPTVSVDVRYAGADNFTGRPVAGYRAPIIYVTQATASALAAVQAELRSQGLGLKLFDGYRPQRAVDDFVRWAEDLQDTRMQARYYPRVAKENLFRDGYIAARSGHSRGSTVDLTLIELDSGAELDMGSPWDFFDPVSWPDSMAVTAAQRERRMLLREIMLRHGFVPLATEWWHFTLDDEPFPQRYFDFVIR